jgi:hypothetical protein
MNCPRLNTSYFFVYNRIRLTVSDIPASKIADVYRGILLPLNRAVGDFKFTIEIDVSSAEGISQATLENQIKETIRQIGGRVVEESRGETPPTQVAGRTWIMPRMLRPFTLRRQALLSQPGGFTPVHSNARAPGSTWMARL